MSGFRRKSETLKTAAETGERRKPSRSLYQFDLSWIPESDLRSRLRWRSSRQPVRSRRYSRRGIGRISSGVRSEFRALLNAVVDARLGRRSCACRPVLGAERARLETRLERDRARVEASLAQERADRCAPGCKPGRTRRLASLRPKRSFRRQLVNESRMPYQLPARATYGVRPHPRIARADQLHALVVPGRTGGRERVRCGVDTAWSKPGYLGSTFTRNIFAELGYRYMYVDYDKNGFSLPDEFCLVYSGESE